MCVDGAVDRFYLQEILPTKALTCT
jgi:hypothetical protein